MIAVCTIISDRKKDSVYCMPRLAELDGDYSVYVNHERWHPPPEQGGCGFGYGYFTQERWYIDQWYVHQSFPSKSSPWRPIARFDQDQSRLVPITTARNMCIDFAMVMQASHLLFVDADVIPPKDVIPKLLELDHPIVGGLVPGRGAHRNFKYVFGEISRMELDRGDIKVPIIVCSHGTCGLMMIKREVFERLRFRYGPGFAEDGHREELSEDPAYCYDANKLGFGNMWIREDVVAEHLGDLKDNETAQF